MQVYKGGVKGLGHDWSISLLGVGRERSAVRGRWQLPFRPSLPADL